MHEQTYRMQLQGKSFRYRKDFRKVWQFCVTKLLDDILSDELLRVLVEHFL